MGVDQILLGKSMEKLPRKYHAILRVLTTDKAGDKQWVGCEIVFFSSVYEKKNKLSHI